MPSPSPDGSRVAYVLHDKGGYQDTRGIWIADADGSNPVRVVAPADLPGLMHTAATWSPDGTKLVFIAYAGEPPHTYQPLIVNVATHAISTLLPADSEVIVPITTLTPPVFSSDGSTVFFPGRMTGQEELVYSVPTSGGPAMLRFGTSGEVLQWFDVSPDGDWLIAVRYQDVGGDAFMNTELWSINGGGAPIQVASFDNTNITGKESGTFSPDGARLLFANRSPNIFQDQRFVTTDMAGAGSASIGSIGGFYPRWSTNLDDCAPFGAATMRINEIALEGGQFVELLDPTDETFPTIHGPYRVVVYDAAGARIGAHTIDTEHLQERDNTQPLLLSTSAADTAYSVTGDEELSVVLPQIGQACFTRGSGETAINCVAWGCVTSLVQPSATRIAAPPAGMSTQRQGVGSSTFRVATPTPKGANVTGQTVLACVPTGGGDGGGDSGGNNGSGGNDGGTPPTDTGPGSPTPTVEEPKPPTTTKPKPAVGSFAGATSLRVVRNAVSSTVACAGGSSACVGSVALTATVRTGGRRPVSKTVVIGQAAVRIQPGKRAAVRIVLNAQGRKLVAGTSTVRATLHLTLKGVKGAKTRAVTLRR